MLVFKKILSEFGRQKLSLIVSIVFFFFLGDLLTLCYITMFCLFSLLCTALVCEFMVIYPFTMDGNWGWTLPLAIVTDSLLRQTHVFSVVISVISKLQYSASLEQDMVTHSSILAWKFPRTERPGRGQPMGSQSRTRLSTRTSCFTFSILRVTSRRQALVQLGRMGSEAEWSLTVRLSEFPARGPGAGRVWEGSRESPQVPGSSGGCPQQGWGIRTHSWKSRC